MNVSNKNKRPGRVILRMEDPNTVASKVRFSLPRMTEGAWKIITWPDRALAQLTIKLIKLYQLTFSPDHSAGGKGTPINGCKFYPSCSHYGINAFKKYGFISGLPRVIWRVLRCHPWSKGGVDEVR